MNLSDVVYVHLVFFKPVRGVSCTMYCHFLDDVVSYRTSEATCLDSHLLMLLRTIKVKYITIFGNLAEQ